MLTASADSLKLRWENSHETLISLSSNTRFFSAVHRYFIQSCFNTWNILLERPCMTDFYFPGIPLLKSSLNLTHFSWLCHRAPPSRTSFSFCIFQVLCRLLTPFTSHHTVPHISTSLSLSWQCVLDLLFQRHFFSCSLKLVQLLCVTGNVVQIRMLHCRYWQVGRLRQHPGHLPFTWFSSF